ncbi:tat pathway signal sequence protein [Rutstroemia sp. NJR-2017a BBW]|nr:tat pathway signal sequence protein [Rutstroemia sp. NJR-2017a BBW]
MYSEDKLSEQNLLEAGDDSVYEKDEESDQPISKLPLSQHYGVPTFIWGLQLIFFLISLSLLLSSFSHCSSQAGICKDHMPMYSPALEGASIDALTGVFRNPTISKDRLAHLSTNIGRTLLILLSYLCIMVLTFAGGVISISEETLHAVNASTEYSVKLAPELGGGYMATVELLHQLHCLDFLRQATYEDYYKDTWEDSPEMIHHCIDNLRQKASYFFNPTQIHRDKEANKF